MKNISIEKINDIAKVSLDECTLYDKAYPKALAKFIKKCSTPITIALQGEWGSGKTSMMNMVKEELKKGDKEKKEKGDEKEQEECDVEFMDFNAWLFSQFNLGDQLPLILLTHLSQEIGFDNKVKDTMSKLAISAIQFLGKKVGGTDNFMSSFTPDDIEQLKNLKKSFENAVENKLKNKEKKKLLIFIDDIDRVEPEKAIELLESIKIFCECKNCIFILAVDYDVILKGAKNKFGEDKGQAFFDKIIQVPFNMPTVTINLNGFMMDLLEDVLSDINNENTKANLSKLYANISKVTLGSNPRSIKRLLNAFAISDYVAFEQGTYLKDNTMSAYQRVLLYSLLCIQNYNNIAYEYIIEKANMIKCDGIDKFINSLDSIITEEETEEKDEFYRDIDEEVFDKDVIKVFIEILNDLKDIINNDAITSMFVASSSAIAKEKKSVKSINSVAEELHNMKVKECVLKEIEKYKNEGKLVSVGNSKSMFTTKALNDFVKCNEFDNNKTTPGNLIGYHIGFYGLKKYSWNTFTFNLGVENIENKGIVKDRIMSLIKARDKLNKDGILENLLKEAKEKELSVNVNYNNTLGKNSTNLLTLRFDDASENEDVLIKNIDSALNWIEKFESNLLKLSE